MKLINIVNEIRTFTKPNFTNVNLVNLEYLGGSEDIDELYGNDYLSVRNYVSLYDLGNFYANYFSGGSNRFQEKLVLYPKKYFKLKNTITSMNQYDNILAKLYNEGKFIMLK